MPRYTFNFFRVSRTCKEIHIVHMFVDVLQPGERGPVHDDLHLLPGGESLEAALLTPDVVGREAVIPTSLDVQGDQVHPESRFWRLKEIS